ncbi:MAG: PhnD/SsuA/transferrin family substrate-binding protein [Hyphomicrobiaceae bacterium]
MTEPLAAMPMYDWPEVRPAADVFWAGIAARLRDTGIAAPDRLTRTRDYTRSWTRPDLLFGQTCGYPYVSTLRGRVQLIATPCYDAPGCEGPTYRSFILVRRDSPYRRVADLRGARAIANSEDSQSGYSALRAVVASKAVNGRFFGEIALSGGHRNSLIAVAEGRADVCAIDAVCVALARRHEKQAMAGLRIIARSPRAPSLPYITGLRTPPATLAALRHAISGAIADRKLAEARAALLIAGCEVLDDTSYDRIAAIRDRAIGLGYPVLA